MSVFNDQTLMTDTNEIMFSLHKDVHNRDVCKTVNNITAELTDDQ